MNKKKFFSAFCEKEKKKNCFTLKYLMRNLISEYQKTIRIITWLYLFEFLLAMSVERFPWNG